jgi:hypothetical protein
MTVVSLPGVFRADLHEDTPVSNVLADAMDTGLIDVTIIGRTADGEMNYWSSYADADKTIAQLMRYVTWLATADQVDDE